jgi:hypothetical protein
VVVNLSVEDYLDRAVFIAQRLGSAFEIDDAEPTMSESDIRVEEFAVAIWPAVNELIAHWAQNFTLMSNMFRSQITGDAAHSFLQ